MSADGRSTVKLAGIPERRAAARMDRRKRSAWSVPTMVTDEQRRGRRTPADGSLGEFGRADVQGHDPCAGALVSDRQLAAREVDVGHACVQSPMERAALENDQTCKQLLAGRVLGKLFQDA